MCTIRSSAGGAVVGGLRSRTRTRTRSRAFLCIPSCTNGPLSGAPCGNAGFVSEPGTVVPPDSVSFCLFTSHLRGRRGKSRACGGGGSPPAGRGAASGGPLRRGGGLPQPGLRRAPRLATLARGPRVRRPGGLRVPAGPPSASPARPRGGAAAAAPSGPLQGRAPALVPSGNAACPPLAPSPTPRVRTFLYVSVRRRWTVGGGGGADPGSALAEWDGSDPSLT